MCGSFSARQISRAEVIGPECALDLGFAGVLDALASLALLGFFAMIHLLFEDAFSWGDDGTSRSCFEGRKTLLGPRVVNNATSVSLISSPRLSPPASLLRTYAPGALTVAAAACPRALYHRVFNYMC